MSESVMSYMNAGFVLVPVLWLSSLSLDGGESHAMPLPSLHNVAVSLLASFGLYLTLNKTQKDMTVPFMILCRAKGFQHQRMTNGAMNVEIGNPAYKIYEGEPDDDAGELLDADFTLDPDKVEKNTRHTIYKHKCCSLASAQIHFMTSNG